MNNTGKTAYNIRMKKPEDKVWELFERTGKPGYYMLYKKLKNKDKQ